MAECNKVGGGSGFVLALVEAEECPRAYKSKLCVRRYHAIDVKSLVRNTGVQVDEGIRCDLMQGRIVPWCNCSFSFSRFELMQRLCDWTPLADCTCFSRAFVLVPLLQV